MIADSSIAEIVALLEDIATDMHAGKTRNVPGRIGPLDREKLCWNVSADEPDEQADSIPPRTRCLITEPDTRGTIVIAEDDEVTRRLLHRILSRVGFTVHACENGQLACDTVRREGADIVLLDWMMPVMDGPTAVANLKASRDTRGIPVVMLTAQSAIKERVVALKTGVQDFITKPFDTRELVARIEQQIRWRRMLTVDANSPRTG